MGFLSRLFRAGPVSHAPPSDSVKQAIVLMGATGDFDGLARKLRSRNPHVRAYTVDAVRFASQTRVTADGGRVFSDTTSVNPRALRLLVPLLDDGDANVRRLAEQALESLKERAPAGGAAHEEAVRALEAYRARTSSAGLGH